VLGIAFVTLLARFGKIYSFSYYLKHESGFDGVNDNPLFQGFSVNFIVLLVYLALYIIIALLCIFLYDAMKYVAEYSAYSLGFLCCFFIINEVYNFY